MAFSTSNIKMEMIGQGRAKVTMNWDGDSVTTGTVTAPNGSTDYGAGLVAITKVESPSVSSNGDTAVISALDVNDNQVKLTFQSSDSGTLSFEGKVR